MKLFFTALTMLFLSITTPTYAQNTFCNRVGNQMVCGPERFEYFPAGKNDKNGASQCQCRTAHQT